VEGDRDNGQNNDGGSGSGIHAPAPRTELLPTEASEAENNGKDDAGHRAHPDDRSVIRNTRNNVI